MRAVLAWIGDWLPPSLYFLLAGNSAASLNGDHDMIESNGPLARLRKAFRCLEDLPEVIPASWRPGNATEPLSVESASVDEIAIAIVAANAELSAAIQRSSALEKLHRLAREAGAVGTDRAVDFALKREGR
ncbi:hypothetical protein [Tabrizicola sp.]|uniref:hypothetical protein n=1 Tax=Tabrizicola sp. TaxID=2005166 RepID=UPI0026001A06|nr:hypothetical protein [Tabrizicola sp.]MBY0350792.1 hypothetical protein [Tabrizicola sp.]